MSHQLDALVGQMGSSALSVEVQELEQLREQCDLIWVHEHLQVPSSTSAAPSSTSAPSSTRAVLRTVH